jgi:hypothetical protein
MNFRSLLYTIALVTFISLYVDAQPKKKPGKTPATKVKVNPNGKVKVAGPAIPGKVKGTINSGGKGGLKLK